MGSMGILLNLMEWALGRIGMSKRGPLTKSAHRVKTDRGALIPASLAIEARRFRERGEFLLASRSAGRRRTRLRDRSGC